MQKAVLVWLLTVMTLAFGRPSELVEPPATIKRSIRPKETHIFELHLEKGWYVEADVSAPATWTDLYLVDPEGHDIASSPTRVLTIANSSGAFRLRVECPAKAVVGGAYILKFTLHRAPSEAQKTLDSASKARMRGEGEKKTSKDAAEKSFREALRLYEEAGDGVGTRETLDSLGLLEFRSGNLQKAQEWFGRELESAIPGRDRASEAKAAFWLGYTYLETEPQRARTYFERSAAVERDLGNLPRVALALNAVAAEYMPADIDRAFAALKEAREIATRLKDTWLLADILTTEGNAYTFRGEFRRALESYEAALPLHRESQKVFGEATTLSNMGEVLTNVGEYKRALQAFDDSIALWKKLGNRVREAYSLHNRARVYAAEGRTELARKEFRSVISTARELNVPEAEAAAWNELGETFIAGKQPVQAIESFRQAIAAVSKGGSARVRGHAFLLRSRAEQELRQNDAAVDDALAALRLFTDISDRNNELLAYEAAARGEYGRGKVEAARAYMAAAMELIESGRAELERRGLQSTYVASRSSFTEFYIQTLIATRRPTDAFTAAERFRARNLLDALGESSADLLAATDSTWAAEDRELRRKLRADAAVVTQVSNSERASVQRRIENTLADLDRLAARRREAGNRATRVASGEPLPADYIQKTVVDPDAVVIEFFLADPQSYAWIVDKATLRVIELPSKKVLEAAARKLRSSLVTFGEERPSESNQARAARRAAATADALQNAKALNQLTFAKLGELPSKHRLAIVPDGALWYTPWSLVGGTAGHEIVVIPSAATLARIRENARGVADRNVAIFADPVYNIDDARVTGRETTGGSILPAKLRRPREEPEAQVAQRFVRLRFSREEAMAISQVLPHGEVFRALGFDASREFATNPEISRYRIVHFAAHTLLNNEHPELSGIVLSLINRDGRPQDGFLRLFDIYRLRLNADLIVLSGCETALGKEMRGEGLIGLTQGFLAAGADHVLATLWPVEDRATAEFMKRFYRFLLVKGLRPGAALAAARQSLRSTPAYASPYYWAAFQLIGDWR